MSLASLKETAPLLQGLHDSGIEFLESVATEVEFPSGAIFFQEDDLADTFYLVAEGKAGLEVVMHTKPPVVIQTIGPGEMLGVSWLFPPYRWSWQARALTMTTAVALDAGAVRRQCEKDTQLALHVYWTVANEAVRRLHNTRIRLLDIYPGAAG